MTKALHEAKVHTSWINPNQPYDDAISKFIARILDPDESRTFLEDFQAFHARIREFGMINSLAQTVSSRSAAPGVPDFYQGTELWDLNLVDPDNRRPVDFAERRSLLEKKPASLQELIAARLDGRIKMFVTQRTLALRRDHPDLFAQGEYLPMEATGPRREQILCFARKREGRAVLVVTPRLLVGVTPQGETPFVANLWKDTDLVLGDLPGRWWNVFTEKEILAENQTLRIDRLLTSMPVCVLVSL